MNNLCVEDNEESRDDHDYNDCNVVPWIYLRMVLKDIDEGNVQSHALLNQNFLVERVFQSIAPLASSFASLGVGLGVRESRD